MVARGVYVCERKRERERESIRDMLTSRQVCGCLLGRSLLKKIFSPGLHKRMEGHEDERPKEPNAVAESPTFHAQKHATDTQIEHAMIPPERVLDIMGLKHIGLVPYKTGGN